MNRIAVALGAALLASPALAQTDFVTVDADASGGASYDEVATVHTVTEEQFAAADANQDGELDESEYTVLVSTLPQ